MHILCDWNFRDVSCYWSFILVSLERQWMLSFRQRDNRIIAVTGILVSGWDRLKGKCSLWWGKPARKQSAVDKVERRISWIKKSQWMGSPSWDTGDVVWFPAMPQTLCMWVWNCDDKASSRMSAEQRWLCVCSWPVIDGRRCKFTSIAMERVVWGKAFIVTLHFNLSCFAFTARQGCRSWRLRFLWLVVSALTSVSCASESKISPCFISPSVKGG